MLPRMRTAGVRIILAGAALLPAGCDEPLSTGMPAIVSAQEYRAGPLVHALDVVLEQSAPITVEYWSGAGPRRRITSPDALTHRLTLAALGAGRTYQYVIRGTSDSGTFTTSDLPADLDSIRFEATGTPTSPLTLVHAIGHGGFRGYVVIDGAGDVVWYWRTEDVPYGMARRANGSLVLLDGGRGLLEVALDGRVTAMVPQTTERHMHHDVAVTPANTVLVIAHDRRELDGRPLDGEAIWEWSPENGTMTKRWSSWDALSPTDDRGPRFGVEWMHANSLALGPRGNVLLSVHYFNQVISLSPDMQQIEWRLGGVNATVTPGDAFSGQHTAREIESGRVLLFDNGVDRDGPSRALELQLGSTTAATLWEWAPPTGNYAGAVGSARRLDNDNTLVAFGMSEGLAGSSGPVEIYEVGPAGDVVWRVLLPDLRVMYRAEPLASLAGEELVPF